MFGSQLRMASVSIKHDTRTTWPHHSNIFAEGIKIAVEGLGGIGGDEEKGVVVVGVFPGVFGSCRHPHAVDGALAFDDDGAFGGEVRAGH